MILKYVVSTCLVSALLLGCGVGVGDEALSFESVSQAATAPLHDFTIGIQLNDLNGSSEGELVYTSPASSNGGWSAYAYDPDYFDPDGVRLDLTTDHLNLLQSTDFRIGVKGIDGGGNTSTEGAVKYTPWASQGGGWSGMASDNDQWNPDGYALIIETRPWPSAYRLVDFRLGIQAMEEKCGFWEWDCNKFVGGGIRYTPFASANGGRSDYAYPFTGCNPDGIKVLLEVTRAL